MKVIDIHTHVVYGIDDGAWVLDESPKFLDREYEQGVRGIFFLKHHLVDFVGTDTHSLSYKRTEALIGAEALTDSMGKNTLRKFCGGRRRN